MALTFFPKSGAMPYGGGYLAMFRWYMEKPFRLLPGRQVFLSAKEARDAADAYMAEKMNGRIKAEAVEAPAALDVEAWRRERAQRREEERERVFGHMPAETVYPRRGRPVSVERRRIA